MELRPQHSVSGSKTSLAGFLLVISRNEKFSLQYVCAKKMAGESPQNMMRRQKSEIFTSKAFEQIVQATSLKAAVNNMVKYLQDEYNVDQEGISQLLERRQESEKLLVTRS